MANFHIDVRDPLPIYAQLERAIKLAIATGAMKTGDRLPTVRELAVELRDQRQHNRQSLCGAGAAGRGGHQTRRRDVCSVPSGRIAAARGAGSRAARHGGAIRG